MKKLLSKQLACRDNVTAATSFVQLNSFNWLFGRSCHEYGASKFGFKYCLLVFETSLCTVKKFLWLFPYDNMTFTITKTLSNTIFRVSDAAAALVVEPDLLRDQHLLLVETWVAGTSNKSINNEEKTNKQAKYNVNNNK